MGIAWKAGRMSIPTGPLSVTWECESVSDAQERLQLAFAMLFSEAVSNGFVDKSILTKPPQTANK